MKNEIDLTQGKPINTLLTFAFPYIIANFLQALYGAADLIIVGRFCDNAMISAVATGSQLLQTLTFLITGLTVSATVLIGKAFGAKEFENIIKIINTMVICFIAAAIVISTAVLLSEQTILNLLQTPQEAYLPALSYVKICSFGLVFIFAYNSISAILRGLGNSVAPMFFVGISCTINIIADIILVGYFNAGATGAATATVISQALSVLLGVIYIRKGNFVFTFKFRQIKFDWQTAKEIFKIGLPLSLQDTLIPLSFLFLFSLANSMGVAASAAYGAVVRLNAFLMLPAGSFAMALTALTAQNLGAGNTKRAVETLKLSILFAFFFGAIFFIWQQLAPKSAIAIFSTDEEILKQGALYLKSFSYDYLFVPFVFCLNGFFFGCGRTIFVAINSICSAFLIRIPVAYILVILISGANLFHLGIAAPSASILTLSISLIYFVHLVKTKQIVKTLH